MHTLLSNVPGSIPYFFTYLASGQSKRGNQGSRSISGSLSHSTKILDCLNARLVTKGISSLLAQMTLDRVALLTSRSWQGVNAVLSVFFPASAAFSCQKRSPFFRRPNCSPIIQPKVSPTRPPSSDGGSAKPENELKVIMVHNETN